MNNIIKKQVDLFIRADMSIQVKEQIKKSREQGIDYLNLGCSDKGWISGGIPFRISILGHENDEKIIESIVNFLCSPISDGLRIEKDSFLKIYQNGGVENSFNRPRPACPD